MMISGSQVGKINKNSPSTLALFIRVGNTMIYKAATIYFIDNVYVDLVGFNNLWDN